MPNIKLSIIIISYNTADITYNCLKSVFAEIQNNKNLKATTEVLIVDNHSTDDSINMLTKLLKKQSISTILIKNKTNFGFSKANNQAIKKANGKYLLLLNSDTIVKKNAISRMIFAMDKHKLNDSKACLLSEYNKLDNLGILSATLFNEDGSFQPHGGFLPTLVSVFCHMFFLDNLPIIGKYFPSTQQTGLSKNRVTTSSKNKIIQKGWVSGTSMMIKREVFNEIGYLDENFFMYGEDLEFCMRAKKHHYDICILTNSEIIHLGSASSSKENALIGEIKGLIYIWSKHMPIWQKPFLKTMLWWGSFLRIIIFSFSAKKTNQRKTYQRILKII